MADPGDRGPLDGEELETWAAVATVLEWLPAALDAQLQHDAGITHFEYGILFALSEADGRSLRMGTLASYSNSLLSRLSRAVTRLERRHWVRREPDPADGRYILAILTDDGFEKVAETASGHAETVRRLVLDPLTATQERQLKDISRRIMKEIRDGDGWQPSPRTTIG
jgi:DNA-binding MarR family transcriptional regulator